MPELLASTEDFDKLRYFIAFLNLTKFIFSFAIYIRGSFIQDGDDENEIKPWKNLLQKM